MAAAEAALALKSHSTAEKALSFVAEHGARLEAARARFLLAESTAATRGDDAAIDAYLKVAVFHDVPSWTARAMVRAGDLLQGLKRPREAEKVWRDVLKNYPREKTEVDQARKRLNDLKKEAK